jgi:hypothetical protein
MKTYMFLCYAEDWRDNNTVVYSFIADYSTASGQFKLDGEPGDFEVGLRYELTLTPQPMGA